MLIILRFRGRAASSESPFSSFQAWNNNPTPVPGSLVILGMPCSDQVYRHIWACCRLICGHLLMSAYLNMNGVLSGPYVLAAVSLVNETHRARPGWIV